MTDVSIDEFKLKCVELIDQVRNTGRPLRLSRGGLPVVEIVPSTTVSKKFVLGDMVGTVEIVGDIVSPVIDADGDED